MIQIAGFEPANKVNGCNGFHEKSSVGTEIGTTNADMCKHRESCPVTNTFPEDLQEIIDAWPKLEATLQSAILAVMRSQP